MFLGCPSNAGVFEIHPSVKATLQSLPDVNPYHFILRSSVTKVAPRVGVNEQNIKQHMLNILLFFPYDQRKSRKAHSNALLEKIVPLIGSLILY